jgi:hypothetical protein
MMRMMMMIRGAGNHRTGFRIVIVSVSVIVIVIEAEMVGMMTNGGEGGTMIETRIDGGVGEMTKTGRAVVVGGGKMTREVKVAVGEGARMRGARAVDMRRIGGLVGGRGTVMTTTTMMSTITRIGSGGVVEGRIGMRGGWGGHTLGDEVD